MIACPQCMMPVKTQARRCPCCGADLALAAALLEREMLPRSEPLRLPAKGAATGAASAATDAASAAANTTPAAAAAASLSPEPGQPGCLEDDYLTPETLVPRLGEALIEQGVLTPAHLDAALAYQQQCAAEGRPRLIGQALMDLGLLSREALDQAITRQIFQLQSALSEANRSLEDRVQARTAELRRALERLSELNQLKANFIANISHELRTPLTHIKGYLDLLSGGSLGELNPAQDNALHVLNRAEARLERLIEDLLQFSLASSGELFLHLDLVNLARLAQEVVERAAEGALRKGVELSAEVQPVSDVPGDAEKLRWVAAQLVDNAVKFTPAPGQVIVRVSAQSGGVQFAVSDTGIGIPAAQLSEIFEPFHQLDSSATRRYPGAGLGLAMAQRIVEAHGAAMQVQSCQGSGSTFSFELACAPPGCAV